MSSTMQKGATMTKRRPRREDPMDRMIEAALQPGRFISWSAGVSFVSDLSHVEEKIEKLIGSETARAVTLYETFLAACTEKAEEIDDSDGDFGMFAGGLYCGWIKARQASDADRKETAQRLLGYMDSDEYGFCNELGRDAVKVFDTAGLEAFELEVHTRLDAARSKRKRQADAGRDYDCQRWGQILRAIYAAQRNVEKYLDLIGQTELTQSDCEAVAIIFQAKRKPNDALLWVERGLGIDARRDSYGDFYGSAGDKLAEMRRALLVKLGRGGEALDSAWAEFREHPGKFTYDQLRRYVPKAEREAWHEKAMAAAEEGELASIIELWLSTKEIDRLAGRLDQAADAQIEGLSHYVSEPAAERLAPIYPGIAAKVFRALGMRIIDAGKSKYYHEALLHFEQAKSCYRAAGLDPQWQAVVAEVRREHHRKTGFMLGFERIVSGKWTGGPSFLVRARQRWAQRSPR